MKRNDSKVVSGNLFRQMVISGANDLFNHYPEIDKLNVFPVPDGDTGTNMNLTITSGSKEITSIDNDNIGEVAKIFSRGLLMGARGNSGVILSQIFRGISKSLTGKETATIHDFALALQEGATVAYKAVMKPQEGTILTVIRESSEDLMKFITEKTTISEALDYLLNSAKKSLEHTPELLPVLKEVGVVDSGGAGLVKIFEGMYLASIGELVERKSISVNANNIVANAQGEKAQYDVKFILKIGNGRREFFFDNFVKIIENLATDVKVEQKDNYLKVECKTYREGGVINSASNYGEILNIDIKNLTNSEDKINYDDFGETSKEWEEFAIITTSVGKGLDDMFKSLNVSYIVSGGQTMNPSTEDFAKAIKTVHAKNVIVLPNNKNILMAAQQASELETECNVRVVPTKTIMQGLVACMMYNPESSLDEIANEMNESIKSVKSGQVTFSIKDTCIDGVEIKKDHFMGIGDGKIKCCLEDKHECAKELLKNMIDENSSIITIIYGDDVTSTEGEALAKFITDNYPVEVELHEGNQPVYSYFIGVE